MSYQRSEWLGTATLSPDDPVVAGSYGSWTITYTVGTAGVDDGARVRLCYRSISDLGQPQFNNPAGANYVSVRATRPVQLQLSYGGDGVRPWNQAITARVSGGALGPGDQLIFTLGDRLHGGPGIRCQTFTERRYTFKLQATPFNTGVWEDVADLSFPIIGGPAAELHVIAPSDVVAGEKTWLALRLFDAWGNPDPAYHGTVTFTDNGPEGIAGCAFTPADGGVRRLEGVRFETPGIVRVAALDSEYGLSGVGNPIRVHAEAPALRQFWGDLHGQSGETIGTGSADEYFAYARDVAAVDVVAHSSNDFQITAGFYETLRETSTRYYQPGRLVTFHGYEWSGNTLAGGDHNVYYLDDGPLRRSSHALVDDTSDEETDCYPIDRLYAANAGRGDVLITPHIGGRMANLDFHDPALEPAIEIASQWGRFEWFARDALARGLQVGFLGGSDDHSGRPGWSGATLGHHGKRGGLTAFLATELTRESIWEALRLRRVYGTSGVRMLIDVTVDGQPLGSSFETGQPPEIAVRVHGTGPLDRIELRRGLETIHTHHCLPKPADDEPWRVRLAWRGAQAKGRSRPLDWSGELRVRHGVITGIENYAIDVPTEGVTSWEPERAAWRSWTCGDWDGLILNLDGDEQTELDIRSAALNLRFSLAELRDGPLRWDGELLEQQFIAQRISHQEPPWDAAFTLTDEGLQPGVNPYWVWVTQADGELGWSSPVYVTCV